MLPLLRLGLAVVLLLKRRTCLMPVQGMFSFFFARILSKLDAFGYSSEAGSAPAVAEKVEVPNVAQGYVLGFVLLLAYILNSDDSGGVIGYGCGYSNWPHSCWKYCIDGKRCWSKPQLTCYEDINCAGDPPCASVCF